MGTQNNKLIPLSTEAQAFQNNKVIKIKDQRIVDAVTGGFVTDNMRMHATQSKDYITKVVTKALDNGVDPYTALAINLQESGMDSGNFGASASIPALLSGNVDKSIDASILAMKNQFNYGLRLGKTSDEDIIQAYNGYGKIKSMIGLAAGDSGVYQRHNNAYGIDLTKQPGGVLDMNNNPVYGKRIIDLRDNILKNNDDIGDIVDSVTKAKAASALLQSTQQATGASNILQSQQRILPGQSVAIQTD